MAASSTAAILAAAVVAVISLLLASTSSASSRSFSAAADGAATNTEFIRTSCSATAYPQLCYSSLAVHATKIQTSAKLLATAALDVSLASARSTSAAMARLQQSQGLSPRETAAMRDCLEELGDSVDLIRQSIDEMKPINKAQPNGSFSAHFEMMISDVQTWVSAALTEESTCNDGFVGKSMAAGEMKTVVRGEIETIAHLTSNALALINAYATHHL
ncbi:unnamed protein product [Linum tenue]|uniref:Pectinesterase inhibitor domain-containing protein n=1 Tax=Linum tenue TaxID=586396 RepID=A0AAV0QP39_9ROSI|nr:unnamed protein product [Linum tenue]